MAEHGRGHDIPSELRVVTPRSPRLCACSSPRQYGTPLQNQKDVFVQSPPESPRTPRILGEKICIHSISVVSMDLNQKIEELSDLVAELPLRLLGGQQQPINLGRSCAVSPQNSHNVASARPRQDWDVGSRDSSPIIATATEGKRVSISTSLSDFQSAVSSSSLSTVPSDYRFGRKDGISEPKQAMLPLKLLRLNSFPILNSGAANRAPKEACFNFFAVLILCNAIFKGFSLQYHSEVGERLSWAHTVDLAFIIVSFFEMVVRWFILRVEFGFGAWDIFDVIVVACMVCDEILRIIADVPWVNPSYLFSALRIFRVTGALKRFGIFDYLSVARPARLLVLSLKAALGTTLCALVCLASVVYLTALVMANGALDLCSMGDDQHRELCFYFGTLWRSCASAYQAFLGGISWVVLVDALNASGMRYHASVFVLIVSVSTVGILQIIAGMFVWLVRDIFESEQKLHFMQDHLKEKQSFVERMAVLFNKIDLNSNGLISRDELKLAFSDGQITALFVSMDLDCTAVENVFDLLDFDSSGFVDVQEFSLGCLRLRGKARAVDLERTRNDVAAIRSAVEQMVLSLQNVSFKRSAQRCQRGADSRVDSHEHIVRLASQSRSSSIASRFTRFSIRTLSSLVGGESRILIEEPEMRALTLSQLQDVASIVEERCQSEQWENPQNGVLLEAAKVNLYDFAFHYIHPQTSSDCITLVGLPSAGLKKGQILTQEHVDSGRVCAKGRIIQDASGKDVHVNVLKGQFVASDDDEIRRSYRMLLDGEGNIGPLHEVLQSCSISYKELVSPKPTQPEWFVCHWWGEPIMDFVACCEEHASRRHADTYWVCAYANRQHDLGADIGDDPENSSFRRAMAHANGLLLVLDRAAIPFQRIWCCFELFKTVTSEKMLDIVTMAQEPQLLTQRPIARELPVNKFLREKHFPLSTLTKGVQVSLENGGASKQDDKVHILESMGKDPSTGAFSLDLQHKNVEFANRTLRSYIAVAAWPQAITTGRVLNFDRKSSQAVSLPDILKQDSGRTVLEMHFSGMQEVTDSDVASIAQGLPPKLESLSLSFEGCYKITDRGIRSLADSVATSNLKVLALDFTGCKLLTDEGISYLGVRLPSTLSDVSLLFALIPNVSKHGAKSFADHLPTSVSHLRITFRGTGFDHQFGSLRQLRKMTR